jgi:hypothetical protein
MAITGAKLFHLFVLFCLVLNCTYAARTQTTTTGAVVGSIYEAGTPGKGVPGATVVVINEENGLERSAITKPDGNYSFEFLPPNRYTIMVTAPGFQTKTIPNFVVRLSETNLVIPPIALQKGVVSAAQPQIPPPTPGAGSPPEEVSGLEQLINTTNATRGQNFDRRILMTLPLPGIRSFDDLAFLAPGVAPPPQAIGNSVGPGLGAGVGTSGQFSVNGLRSRSNNYTIDGSDNNDEDIGVRRQGFTSLVPQTIESLQEFRIITLLPEPQFGRNMAAQVNAVSRSGGSEYHGMLYGFFTHNALRARDVFDLTGGDGKNPITRRSDGRAIKVDGDPLAPLNPVEGENEYRRGQYGFVIGGPVVKKKLFFFGSVEYQDINAERESHFAVPRVAERGLTLNIGGADVLTGDSGISRGGFFGGPTSLVGDAFFSLFPFPNSPLGPYGANTYTEVLPADADGIVFSMKMDRPSFKAFGKDHSFTGRYNFTDDDTTLPVTGGAIFSSLTANVRTQNLSLFLTSVINQRLSNEFRASYGRTSLGFEENRSKQLIASDKFGDGPKAPKFLLNRPLFRNISRVGFDPGYVTLEDDVMTKPSCQNADSTEDCTGPLGQLIVAGFSPVGVDVINFPQGRVNNTFQYADTLLFSQGNQKFTAGADIRRIQLNSSLDRNFRPVAVFNGEVNESAEPRSGIPLPSLLQGRDFLAVGAPTGFTQTLTLTTIADSTIGLRSWQNDFFFSDQARLRPNLTVTVGARYQINTVPTEVTGRIEKTFEDVQAQRRISEFLQGRQKIYERDSNNIAPHIAFAWDPSAKGMTSVRGGYGIYYDQIPGAVVSQSRAVFPTFFTFNLAGIKGLSPSRNPGLEFINPATLTDLGNSLNTFVIAPGVDVIDRINQALESSLDDSTSAEFAFPDFVLPAADLVTPYSQHWGLTLEHTVKEEFLLSVGYVGTKGVHLLRFNTPNGGPNKLLTVVRAPAKLGDPNFEGESKPPERRLDDALGSFTSIESDANSIYHGLQIQLNKRLSHGIQFTTAYTWSHAIDESSDLFDLAGARALPQNSFDRRAERGDANFDVRHRFVYSFIYDLPGSQNNLLLGGWQVSSIGTFQTGQPYSVYVPFDANQDGNLTDRVEPNGTLAGEAGRNLFRAPGIASVDISLNKYFRFSENQSLEFRTEVFNVFNRSNFGVPVNQLFFGGMRSDPREQVFVDTRVPLRTIQFALKYKF